MEGVFLRNLMNDLICDKLKKVIDLQDIIKKDNLNYKLKYGKTYNFGINIHYLLFFKRYT